MELKKINEIKFDNYYIFILENIGKKKLLIDDTDATLSILDCNLQTIKKVPINPDFGMHNVYKSCNDAKVIFSSAEEPIFLFVNLITGKNNMLSTTHLQSYFSRLYYWQDDYLILITRHGDFYHYQDESNNLVPLPASFVKNTFPQFYNFYKFYKKFSAKISINSCDMSFIQFDDQFKEVEFHDFKNNFTARVNKPTDEDFTDILYCNEIFVFVYEEVLLICYKGEIFRFLPESSKYIFIKARFIQEDTQLFLVILLVDRCDFYVGKIQKYEIRQ